MSDGRKLSSFTKPMLAKETAEPFNDSGWLFEIKWDGFRAIAETGKTVRLYSRNGNDFKGRYVNIVNALGKIKQPAVIDGEIVVLNEEGFPDFQKMQDYENNTHLPIMFYAFDLLESGGKKLYSLPLVERKKMLKEIIPAEGIIKFSDHVVEDGHLFFDAAVNKNLEGIMAKKMDSEYYPGKRTNEWLKIKNHKTADVVIAGYTEPAGARKFFGSLVLGFMKDGKLVHAGNAGTGYTEKSLNELHSLLQKYIMSSSPFQEKLAGKITWVKPVLVCEVKFTEWTRDRKLRHPVFLRLRNDKPVKDTDMKNQRPVEAPEKKSASKKTPEKLTANKKVDAKKTTTRTKNSGADSFEVIDGKNKVPVSNPGKIYWPGENITKQMMVEYYQAVAPYLLPFLKDRPQSLKRNPNGINNPGFFHKDAGEAAPSFVKSFPVHSGSSDKIIDYIVCNNKATLAYMNNLGCIEINPWHSTIKNPGQPDYMIIDIDPSDNNTFDQVIESAQVFKTYLDKAGAKSFCKTSGASGIHIYVPMGKKYTYEEVKNFAQILCIMVSEELDHFTTVERSLQKRSKDKIYLDFLQNRSGQTISSVYSLRPKPGAPVSMPLAWKEVKPGITPRQFHIHNALQKIKKTAGIFDGVLGPGTNIGSALKKLGA